jgi:hypothetical protein
LNLELQKIEQAYKAIDERAMAEDRSSNPLTVPMPGNWGGFLSFSAFAEWQRATAFTACQECFLVCLSYVVGCPLEHSNARMMSLKFKNPPISELVIGVYFDREIPSLRSEHVGLFWGQVRQDFPNIQQQPIVAAPPLQPFQQIFLSSEFWMPRFWLEASDGSTLMQIQKNAFLFNWRKRETEYPHFDAVKAAFDKNKKRFFKFLSDELSETEPQAQLAELNYINAIESCE